jgi:predicted metal-dependent TIM-barrel fold hydrolase
MIVKESINFERSGTPIEKIGIGQKEVDRQIIENTLWDNWTIEDLKKDNYEVINLIKNYKGINILILKDKFYLLKLPYIAVPSIVFTPQVSYQYCKTPKEAEDDTKSKIDQILSSKIKESLDFIKSGDPIKKMDIGKSTIDRKIIEDTIWNGFTIDYFKNNGYKIIDLIRNYRGNPILVLKRGTSESIFALPYIAFSPFNFGSFYFKTPENAIKFIKEEIDKHLYLMGESINFERKGTPIEKIDIGQQEMLRQKAVKIDWDWNDPDEKLLKVFEWKPYWIKITEVKRNGKIQYRGTSDCGEPYMDEPDLYDTPKEAEEKIKSWLYDY